MLAWILRHTKDSGKEGHFSACRSQKTCPIMGGGVTQACISVGQEAKGWDGEKTFNVVLSRSIMGGLDLGS